MEIKTSNAVFKVPKRLEGNLAPSPARIFPKSSDQDFEIFILLIIFESPNKYAFRYNITPPPQPQVQGL